MRRMSFQRSWARVRLQAGKAIVAASTARSASSLVPSGKRPITCVRLHGFTDRKVVAAPVFNPPIRFFPSIGRRNSTLARTSANASRLDSFEKSVSGSFLNSGSTVARSPRGQNLPDRGPELVCGSEGRGFLFCHSEVADAPAPPPKRLRRSSVGGEPLWRRRERSDELPRSARSRRSRSLRCAQSL